MKKTLLTSLATGLFVIGMFGMGQANVITGSLWHVPEATSQNAVLASVPGGTPYVTFDVNSPMNFSGTGATVSAWLASSSAFNINENVAGTLASFMDNGTTGTLLDFQGVVSVTNGQTFTVTHDDGLTLKIGNTTVINTPGPTSPTMTTATYFGPTGNFAFELVYGECCGGPAVLQIDLPFSNAVPEPATMLLFGAGVAGLAAVGRRKRS